MILDKYTLSREQFDALSKEEQVFLVQMLNFLNELWISWRTALLSYQRLNDLDGLALSAQIAQVSFFIKIHAGLLYEAWRTIEKNFDRLNTQHQYDIPDDAEQSLSALKRYFNDGNNLVKYIRHKHSFHSDDRRVAEGIRSVASSDPIEIVMQENYRNFFCAAAEMMPNAGLLAFIDEEDPSDAIEKFVMEVLIEVTELVTDFAHAFCATVCGSLGATPDKITLEDVPQRSAVRIPYFVNMDGEHPTATSGDLGSRQSTKETGPFGQETEPF